MASNVARRLGAQFWMYAVLGAGWTAAAERAFEIRIVDTSTGRGIPWVEVHTVHHVRFWTDNAGRIAVDEPDLWGQRVFFHIHCPGYLGPRDGFEFEGLAFDVQPGHRVEVRLQRTNIAERLYRVTGAGLYSHSIRLGYTSEVPIPQPLLNAGVVGQDSVQACVYRDRIYWFYGDTSRMSHPLGNFLTTGAISLLPNRGGLSPDVGVALTYFTEGDFVRAMAPEFGEGMVWIDGVCNVPDVRGQPRLVAHYARMKSLEQRLGHGLALFNDERGRLERIVEFDRTVDWRHPAGQATTNGGYAYFNQPVPTVRVLATFESLTNPVAYEAFTWTPHRGWHWQREHPPMTPVREQQWVRTGEMPADVVRFTPRDATGRPIIPHAGSVRWNRYRHRWAMIFVEVGGQESYLGEVWYAEADDLTGPWTRAVKIASHGRYSFYNPVHHEFFDEGDGRWIYFEGTLSETFSGARYPSARYDYNQLMYRLDLADPRLLSGLSTAAPQTSAR